MKVETDAPRGAEDKHLIEDFHFNVVVQLPASRAENGANGFGYASILANYPVNFRLVVK